MSLPNPDPGLVLRYGYLWAADAAVGVDTGKDRPAAIVFTVIRDPETCVFMLPITHSAPAAGTEAMEIPTEVCRRARLDAARAWIVLSEFNEFVWPGYDLSIIPNRNPPSMAYGFLTARFFNSVRERCLELIRQRKAKSVSRD